MACDDATRLTTSQPCCSKLYLTIIACKSQSIPWSAYGFEGQITPFIGRVPSRQRPVRRVSAPRLSPKGNPRIQGTCIVFLLGMCMHITPILISNNMDIDYRINMEHIAGNWLKQSEQTQRRTSYMSVCAIQQKTWISAWLILCAGFALVFQKSVWKKRSGQDFGHLVNTKAARKRSPNPGRS